MTDNKGNGFTDPYLGREIAECMLHERLGEGGMGAVYKAYHQGLDQMVAIKVLPLPCSQELAMRFWTEGVAQSKLNSAGVPYVAKVLHAQRDPPVIIMELLKGMTLEAYLDIYEKELSDPRMQMRLLQVDMKIADALALAHGFFDQQKQERTPILHRDLKPGNIWIRNPKEEVLDPVTFDWGLARVGLKPDLTQSSSGMGSPLYVSPEQINDPENVDHRTDIWSMGLVLFRHFTGDVFYNDVKMMTDTEGPADQGYAVLAKVNGWWLDPGRMRDRLRMLPIPVRDVVEPCLQITPANRYQGMWEFKGACVGLYNHLRNLVEGEMHEHIKVLQEKKLLREAQYVLAPVITPVPKSRRDDETVEDPAMVAQVGQGLLPASPGTRSSNWSTIGLIVIVLVMLLFAAGIIWVLKKRRSNSKARTSSSQISKVQQHEASVPDADQTQVAITTRLDATASTPDAGSPKPDAAPVPDAKAPKPDAKAPVATKLKADATVKADASPSKPTKHPYFRLADICKKDSKWKSMVGHPASLSYCIRKKAMNLIKDPYEFRKVAMKMWFRHCPSKCRKNPYKCRKWKNWIGVKQCKYVKNFLRTSYSRLWRHRLKQPKKQK